MRRNMLWPTRGIPTAFLLSLPIPTPTPARRSLKEIFLPLKQTRASRARAAVSLGDGVALGLARRPRRRPHGPARRAALQQRPAASPAEARDDHPHHEHPGTSCSGRPGPASASSGARGDPGRGARPGGIAQDAGRAHAGGEPRAQREAPHGALCRGHRGGWRRRRARRCPELPRRLREARQLQRVDGRVQLLADSSRRGVRGADDARVRARRRGSRDQPLPPRSRVLLVRSEGSGSG